MSESLSHQHCQPCQAGVPPLTAEEVVKLLADTPDWQVNAENTQIKRQFAFKGFLSTMSFVNAVAYIAQQQGHHPDLHVGYNYCTIHYTTHAIGGLSVNDFICAQKINVLMTK